jgi:EAL domain-containing protein (putative c-di-GMP-specific phosphodiesterase class I)
MVGWLGDLLKRFQIQPPSLVLEITETSAMAPGTAAVMKELDELGVRLSIDDFGTGYSSLAYLQRLPVDLIKIDRSFVGEMLTNAGAASIVRSVIDLAHNLGLQSVAEGVERREVEQMLTELGCDYAQGYYISRPLAAEAASGWIAGRGQKAA